MPLDRKNALLDRLGPSGIDAVILELCPEMISVSGGQQGLTLCWHHHEETPSCSVQRSSGLYNCKSCGAKGDFFSLVMHKRGCDFKDALNYLESRAGIVTTTTSKATALKVKTRKVATFTFTFTYTDAEGLELYQKERHKPARDGIRSKEFFFSHKDKKGNRQKGYQGDHVPYRLHKVVKASLDSPVYVVEGEAKADLLASWVLVAICVDTGADGMCQ